MPPRSKGLPAGQQVDLSAACGNLTATTTIDASLAVDALVALCDIVTAAGARRADVQPGPDTVPGGTVAYEPSDDYGDRQRGRTIRGLNK